MNSTVVTKNTGDQLTAAEVNNIVLAVNSKPDEGPQGPAGTNGSNGTNGTNGVGVPAGGTAGQVLAKNTNADDDTHWVDAGGGSSLPVPVADTQSIPFNQMLSVIGDHTVSANIAITPNAAGAIAGCGAIQRIIADGQSTVDLSAFKKLSTSGDFSNIAGTINLLIFYFDGTNYNLSISQNGTTTAPVVPAEVSAWAARLATAGYNITNDRETAYANFITTLKSNSLYDLISEMWMFEGGTAATNALGFKNVSNATFHGTVTHESTGSTGDGATGYMDLGISPHAIGYNKLAYAAYLRKANSVANGWDLGSLTSNNGYNYLSSREGTSYYGIGNVQDSFGAHGGGVTNGRFIGTLIASEMHMVLNGAAVTNTVPSGQADGTNNFFVFAGGGGANAPFNFSDQEFGFMMLSSGLTLGQAYILDAAMATLFTALGR